MNAVVMNCYARARSEAKMLRRQSGQGRVDGPLHGVPMTIKDSLDTEGVISTGATYGRQQYVPKKDATVVGRGAQGGGHPARKTNTPEFTLGGLAGINAASNLLYGSSHNPYDLTRTTSGFVGRRRRIVAPAAAVSTSAPTGAVRFAVLRITTALRASSPPVARAAHRSQLLDYGGAVRFVAATRTDVPRVKHCTHHAHYQRPGFSRCLLRAGAMGRSCRSPILRNSKWRSFPQRVSDTDEDTKNTVKAAVKWLSEVVMSVKEDLPKDILEDLYDARHQLTGADGWQFYKRLADKWGTHNFLAIGNRTLEDHQATTSAETLRPGKKPTIPSRGMLDWMKRSPYDVFDLPPWA